jgi:hypothetical protein
MRVKIYVLTFVLIGGISTFPQQSTRPARETPDLVFEGTVLQIGPDSGRVSGRAAFYQLVKYRVDRVCEGSYSEKEIVVDHLILYHKQLSGVRVGDKLCVAVNKSSEIFARNDVDGIRAPSDVITTFFIGGQVRRTTAVPCACPRVLFISRKRIKN